MAIGNVFVEGQALLQGHAVNSCGGPSFFGRHLVAVVVVIQAQGNHDLVFAQVVKDFIMNVVIGGLVSLNLVNAARSDFFTASPFLLMILLRGYHYKGFQLGLHR